MLMVPFSRAWIQGPSLDGTPPPSPLTVRLLPLTPPKPLRVQPNETLLEEHELRSHVDMGSHSDLPLPASDAPGPVIYRL